MFDGPGTRPSRAGILSKWPAEAFFRPAAVGMGRDLGDTVMVGDYAESNVAGAIPAAVSRGILVRTGKYRRGDETRFDPQPSAVSDDMGADLKTILG